MGRKLLRMIAPSSLSAFSASVANGGIRVSGTVGGPAGVQPMRVQPATPHAAPPSGPAAPRPGGTGAVPLGPSPRGALLDITA